MLTGRFRRGSGITGSGGDAEVAPVVSGPLCGSDALICMLRLFGAGFGIGTVCATDGATTLVTYAAIIAAKPMRMPRIASRPVIGDLGFLFNASSRLAFSHFNVLSAKGDIVFP